MKESFLYEDIMLSNSRSTKKILTAIAGPAKLPLRTIYSGSCLDEMHHWFEMHKHHTNEYEHGHVHGPLFEYGHGHHQHSHQGARHMHSEIHHNHAHDLKSVSRTEESQKTTFKAW